MNMIGSMVYWMDAGGYDYIFFLLGLKFKNGAIMVALVK